jgi:signal transduction histidine kinase/CheY-like chemotaxis protein
MAQLSPDTVQRLLTAQVEAHARTDRDARWLETVVNALVAAFFYWQTSSPLALLWAVLRVPVHWAGRWNLSRYSADEQRAQHGARWARRFALSAAVDSALWGLGCWLLPPAGDPLLHGLMVILIGLASSAVVYGTQLWPAVLGWALPMSLGLLTALLWQGEPVFLFMAVCVAIHLGIVLYFGGQQQRLMTQTLLGRFEKEELAEQLARQAQAAQRASEEKTRFLAAASHDLRQPVHAIGLFGAVLERELQAHPQHASAERLLRAVDALGHSLDAMLDVSRLDAGLIEPVIAATPMNPILQALGQIFTVKAEERALQLRVRATPLWVRTDGELLQRMLANMIENGLKYTAHGGVLVLARARGDEVWIDVADTGIGIAPEHREQVFAEFYQIGNPGRDRSRGLGMGLSIVQRLSRLLDHPVQLRSRPGRGSRFRIVLPIAQAAQATERAREEPQVKPAPLPFAMPAARVLLVEDEDDIAHAMAVLLRAQGMTLAHAATPAEAEQSMAQARAAGRPFDAIICDLRLAEGADGLALALKLRAQDGKTTPTLLITGETAPEPLQRVRATGLPVLFKPVTAPVLCEALMHALERADAPP